MRNLPAFIALLALLALPALGLIGCGQRRVIVLATGYSGGTYYPIGEDLARLVNEHGSEGWRLEKRETAGSVENVALLEKGEVQSAFIQSNIAHFAYTGEEMFKVPIRNLTGICSLFPEALHLVTLPDRKISSVDDLRKKNVSVGPTESGTESDALKILSAAGLYRTTGRSDVKIQRLGFEESLEQLKDGLIDAFFWTGGCPIKALMSLEDMTLVPIDGELADKVVELHPYFHKWEIPENSYFANQHAVDTIAVTALWVVDRSVQENVVYDLTKTLWEFKKGAFLLGFFNKAHMREVDIKLQSALTKMTIPLHPGAERYYREKKILL